MRYARCGRCGWKYRSTQWERHVEMRHTLDRKTLEATLAEVYTPAGVAIWLTSKHKDWDMTVDEMVEAGRAKYVMQKAEQAVTGGFS